MPAEATGQEPEEAMFSGTYDRWVCPRCAEIFEIEHPSQRDDLACDACDWTGSGVGE